MTHDDDRRIVGAPGGNLSDDQIEALLRRTGRRSAPPRDRQTRVRAEVHARWRVEIERRSRRRIVWGLVALAAASVVAAIGVGTWRGDPGASPVGPVGKIEAVSGAARFEPGDVLRAGSVLDTDGGGRIAARLGSGHSLRLDTSTVLRVLGERSLRLEQGTVYVDAHPTETTAGSFLTIATSPGFVRDVGTQFEVRVADAAVRIRVREGTVSLTGEGDVLEVATGEQLDVDAGGRVERSGLTAFDPAWNWAADAGPAMTIEGRPLRTFLDWTARERGLALRFSSDDLAASAATITLNGSIEGMTLDEALRSVLPTCRMRHHIESGALLIDSLAQTEGVQEE